MQMSLRTRVTEECCIFPDVMDIYEAGSKQAYKYIAEGADYPSKLERAMCLPARESGWCLQHQRECRFCTGSDLRVGGFPCQDFSTAGRQEGLQGANLPFILGFGKKARHTRNNLLTIENVPSCPRDLVHDAFGSCYSWCAEKVFGPSDVGFDFINRPRPASVLGPNLTRALYISNAHIYVGPL